MKRLLLIIILTFSFQTLVKADDIRDFEIEGISIGDSLLDHFSVDEINDFPEDFYPKSKKFYIKYLFSNEYTSYDIMKVALKKNSNQIYSLSGSLFFDNFDKCNIKKKEIIKSISTSFKVKIDDKGIFKVPDLADNQSKKSQTEIPLLNGSGLFSVQCTDWSLEAETKNNWRDNLSVTVYTKEYENFLRNEAY